jgi:hypothetical protein
MSSEPLQSPSDLHPSEENIRWVKANCCGRFAESLKIDFSYAQSRNVRRNMLCCETGRSGTLFLLWSLGTAMGYEVLGSLATLFNRATTKELPIANQLYAVIIAIFVLELLALDEEITSNELPEEITNNPEFCSAIQEWLPYVGQWCYDNLTRSEDETAELYPSRVIGKPLAPEAVATS